MWEIEGKSNNCRQEHLAMKEMLERKITIFVYEECVWKEEKDGCMEKGKGRKNNNGTKERRGEMWEMKMKR